MDLMEEAYALAGGRTKQKVSRVRLDQQGWGLCHQEALRLAHMDPGKDLNVFTDASEGHWGAVVTQVPQEKATRPVAEQEPEPFMFLSGSFSGAARRWPIIEKEVYALVETVKRADFMLHRTGGFAL
jgi:hypothetical protein